MANTKKKKGLISLPKLSEIKKEIPVCQIFKNSMDSIEKIFANSIILKEFYHFSCNEFSNENLFLYLCVRDYAKLPTFPKAHFIVSNFLESNSTYEANTSQKNILQVKSRLDYYNQMHVYANKPAEDIFNEIFKDAKLNLSDTIARFQFIPSNYKSLGKWLYKIKISNEGTIEVSKAKSFIPSMIEAGFQLPAAIKNG